MLPMSTSHHAQFKDRLRDAGLRATRPRVAVLETLAAHEGPLSHGDVVEALSEEAFDRATLFRNLNDLAGAGLLRRLDVGDHVWRFELVADHDHEEHHAHFVCTDCGEVQCLPSIEVKAPGRSDLLARSHEVQIRGVCGECA